MSQVRSASKQESNYSAGLERQKDKATDELLAKTLD
jgi:hypothetical protein